jgi:hypothetical protein
MYCVVRSKCGAQCHTDRNNSTEPERLYGYLYPTDPSLIMRGIVGVSLVEEKGRLVMQKDVKRLEYVALVHTSMHRRSVLKVCLFKT